MKVVFPERTVFSMDAEKSIDGAMEFFDFLNASNKEGEFFFTGKMVEEHPAECKKISKKYFSGAHGFGHENFSRKNYAEQKSLVEKTQNVFSENNVALRGWRFPRLQFNSASMRVLAEKNLPDFSLSEQKLLQWGKAIFFWNFLKCALTEQTIFFPSPFPAALEEQPFATVDLFEKDISICKGRVILHCYNFNKIKNEIAGDSFCPQEK